MSAPLDTEKLVPLLKEDNRKLRQELADRKARQMGTYRLGMPDIVDLGRVYRAIEGGDVVYGLRHLEAILDDLDPRWRSL